MISSNLITKTYCDASYDNVKEEKGELLLVINLLWFSSITLIKQQSLIIIT